MELKLRYKLKASGDTTLHIAGKYCEECSSSGGETIVLQNHISPHKLQRWI